MVQSAITLFQGKLNEANRLPMQINTFRAVSLQLLPGRLLYRYLQERRNVNHKLLTIGKTGTLKDNIMDKNIVNKKYFFNLRRSIAGNILFENMLSYTNVCSLVQIFH